MALQWTDEGRAQGAVGGPRLRVLVVTHTAQLGGAELALLRLVTEMGRDREDVRLLSFSSGPLVDELRALGVEVEVLLSATRFADLDRSSSMHPIGMMRLALGLSAHAVRVGLRIRRLRPDVVQSWTIKAHLVTSLAWPIYRRPLLWFLHDRITDEYLGRRNRWIMHLLSRVPRAVLANSSATAATLGRDCVVAYPGLSADQFSSRTSLEHRGVSPRPELLMLGRLSPTKGQREAIIALRLVRDICPNARLRIVGDALFGESAYADQCRSLVEESRLVSVVDFVGQVSDPRIELDSASVLIHASPVAEPFGQVIAEAMARGVPVVATDAGGVPELLTRNGEPCGLLVPPGDPRALARAVVEVLTRPDEASMRARQAYEQARERFTIAQTAAVLRETWERVSAAARG